MKKAIKIVVVLILFILENLLLWNVADSNFQYKQYQNILEFNKGLTKVCKEIQISEELIPVLEKMNKFRPKVNIMYDKLHLIFDDEWEKNPGVEMLFNVNNQLTHKSCNSQWEPEDPFKILLK